MYVGHRKKVGPSYWIRLCWWLQHMWCVS